MTDFNSSEVTSSQVVPQQTETSPLKSNSTRKTWLPNFFHDSVSDQEQTSLKAIILNFFGVTVILTVALLAQIYYGGFQNKPHGSVATDSYECSKIGTDILKKGGNAVDAAIAATLCLGVVNFHITGLGGGGYMIIYNHKSHKFLDILDFNPTAPESLEQNEKDIYDSGLSVGVPGLLLGLSEAHQNFGKLPWEDLVMPASNLAKNGFEINTNIISAQSYLNLKSKYNKDLTNFLNSLMEGENITIPELANTLKLIASSGAHTFYNGTIAKDIINAVKNANGILTLNDLSQYQVSHSELLQTRFINHNIFTPGSSSGGALLLNALDNIQLLDLTSDDEPSTILLKISDILHDTYISFLQKKNAVPNNLDPVASQVSVIDNTELYVTVISGLNSWLGSQILTKRGFILNNAVANGGISQDRRPLSFATPVLALENEEICGNRLILGSGDAITAVQVLVNALLFNKNISSSIEYPRFFVNHKPREIKVEALHNPLFNPDILNKLKTLMTVLGLPPPYKSVNVIQKIGDSTVAYSDTRGLGGPSEFK